MSYFETTKVKDPEGNLVHPAEEGSLSILRRIFQILKPLSIVTGNGSNRLNVDVNTVGSLPTLNTVNTVGTVNNVGVVSAFDVVRALSRSGYSNGPRANLVIT